MFPANDFDVLLTALGTVRLMCGVKLGERKKSEELRELLGLEPVHLMSKSRLRWDGLDISFSLSFNGYFPGEPGLAVVY